MKDCRNLDWPCHLERMREILDFSLHPHDKTVENSVFLVRQLLLAATN